MRNRVPVTFDVYPSTYGVGWDVIQGPGVGKCVRWTFTFRGAKRYVHRRVTKLKRRPKGPKVRGPVGKKRKSYHYGTVYVWEENL